MGKLTAKQVATLSKGEAKRYSDGNGLYLCVPKSGAAFWMLRYTSNGKRREMSLQKVTELSLANARAEAAIKLQELRSGEDPLLTRKRETMKRITTVDHLFSDWYNNDIAKRLKHPNIPKRLYEKDIAPQIGDLPANEVSPRDIRTMIQTVASSGRPTIANDVLMYSKQLFRHGIKLDVLTSNPAEAFSTTDAGGVEKSRDRRLSIEELTSAFRVFRENGDRFTRDNYLACALLVTLGVRKAELICATWSEFDLDKRLWNLPSGRSKTGAAITIPLPESVTLWLDELKVRGFGSEYLFPNRRASKRFSHISLDTLNHAIAKLCGKKVDSNKQPLPNLMGDAGVDEFSPHDLRRTCRTLMAAEKVPGHVAERCLNHKLKGVEGIYDRYDYLEERKEALQVIANLVAPIVNQSTSNLS
ncbi:site-specific integrase [Neptunomonas sp.]|uniref:tyrosine-type recombinase/integrase n=1 Tax=Neptunomonas sp. TaxID=1971898 RepID=UPI0025F69DBE|nr:site-specific integrase [Neptunomonas sp.]